MGKYQIWLALVTLTLLFVSALADDVVVSVVRGLQAMEATNIPTDTFKVGFTGAGQMAESIARGVVQSGVLPPHRILTTVHSNPSRGTAFESFGIKLLPHSNAVITILSIFLDFVLYWI